MPVSISLSLAWNVVIGDSVGAGRGVGRPEPGAVPAVQWRERRTSDPMSRINATRPSPRIVAALTSDTLR